MRLFARLHQLPVDLARLGPVYEAAAVRHPVLASYPTIAALLPRLACRRAGRSAERNAIVCALIELARDRHSRLWSTLLLYAFLRMLRRIRRRLFGASAEMLSELLLVSFTEAVAEVDTLSDPNRIYMYVRQATRRRVFGAIRDELAWLPFGFGADADLEADPRSAGDRSLHGVWLRERYFTGARIELLATMGDHGALWRLVRLRYGKCTPSTQARIYRRLQKRRDRLVAHLRRRAEREAA
jgi:hypothetical protein